jgi:plasmid stabilization system protein ParE
LADLIGTIGSANPRAADDVQDAIQDTLALLESQPLTGAAYRTRNRNVRGARISTVSGYRRFVVLYLPTADGIEVLHITRGRRNLSRLVAQD